MTWTSDARSVNGWFCAAFGRRTARKVRKRIRQSIELDLSFRSKKERRSNVEMARSGVLWRGYAHHLGYMTQGVIIHTHMA